MGKNFCKDWKLSNLSFLKSYLLRNCHKRHLHGNEQTSDMCIY